MLWGDLYRVINKKLKAHSGAISKEELLKIVKRRKRNGKRQ